MKNKISHEELKNLYTKYSAEEYRQQLLQIVNGVRAVLRPLSILCHIKYRVKSFDEYSKKWNALGGTDQTPIGDMLGIRIICPFLEDLHVVERALEKELNISEVDHKGMERSFSEFGYESTHMLLDLNSETIEHPLPGVAPMCEIQLRTILQDAWAEVEHELIYKSDWSIPTDQIRRKLAALNANLSLSDVIFQELRDFQKDVQRKQEKRRQIQNTRSGMVQREELTRRLDTEQVEEDSKEDLEKLVLRALTAHSDESFSRAVRLYSRVLLMPQADPIRSIILNHRGMAYFAIGENNAARADFRAALAIDDRNHRAWYNLGLTHQALGDSNWALDAFGKSRKIDPEFFDAQLQYIRALLGQKDILAARACMAQLSAAHRAHPDMIAVQQELHRLIEPESTS
ncbi:MAG: tetratricopeptide repeat protein [Deltaproteobacteria bacterium]|nr:tetratricopeptide repeat protein [Deltaproteobacteria bacterium]MBN2671442.1 tetratricopeptide repeat protein [Deltaproteobacteria bacterium]